MINDNIADLLVYSTARITCSNATESESGTAFFMLHKSKTNGNYLALVTNKADEKPHQLFHSPKLLFIILQPYIRCNPHNNSLCQCPSYTFLFHQFYRSGLPSANT